MNLPVVDARGRKRREIEVADEVFGIEPNRAVMHQAYVAQRANARLGTHSTKSRGEVRGSTAKIRRQKGMGAARKGANRAATRVGGGIAFGPKPHSHAKALPRQMRRLAIRSALSSHAASGGLIVVSAIAGGESKTREVAAALNSLGLERRALIVSSDHDATLVRAARNIANVRALPSAQLNVVDLVDAHHVVMTEDAVRRAEELWGGPNVKLARGRREAS